MTGQLTTHVLDTAQGCPADHLAIALWFYPVTGDQRLLRQTYTNQNGRTDTPLLADGELQIGIYELVFAVGAYFARTQPHLSQPYFLDQVPIRFGIADPKVHYHIPLLVSPWSYSTYRGS